MARVHCPQCGIDVVTDPSGRCPEGHLVAASQDIESTPHADEATPDDATPAGADTDDGLLAALEALTSEPPAGDDPESLAGARSEPERDESDGLALEADLPPPPAPAAAPPTRGDEREDIQATLAALGVEPATEPSGSAATPDTGPQTEPGDAFDKPREDVETAADAPDDGIDVGNFTAQGGRVGRGGRRRRWSLGR